MRNETIDISFFCKIIDNQINYHPVQILSKFSVAFFQLLFFSIQHFFTSITK